MKILMILVLALTLGACGDKANEASTVDELITLKVKQEQEKLEQEKLDECNAVNQRKLDIGSLTNTEVDSMPESEMKPLIEKTMQYYRENKQEREAVIIKCQCNPKKYADNFYCSTAWTVANIIGIDKVSEE